MSARAELAESINALSELVPGAPVWNAHLALALGALARRLDELERRLESAQERP